ncbi:MAG: lysine-2,3-aminomutase-like protein [Acidocella sp.]|nr:lysine-2,3-aminomutase-like protein [Acidocella sp.]
MPDGSPPPNLTLRSPKTLATAGLIAEVDIPMIEAVAARYAIAIPPALAALITAPNDPIGRQFIPHADELITALHESTDPIADEALSPVLGLVHRYPDRALLKPLLACPVYCRFCFRREQIGPDGGLLTQAQLGATYEYLRAHPGIREVILTGGDPLILSPRRLGDILANLSSIPHIEVLRIHTRVPVADPSLVTEDLASALDITTPLFIAVHINHAAELTAAACAALNLLQRRAIPILGQSVLLAGVNDTEALLADLFRAMLRARIKPYYLHQLDAAPGTARFYVSPERGRALMAALRGKISGTALPVYVFEQPGGAGKLPL